MYRINRKLFVNCAISIRRRSVSRVSNVVLYVCFDVAINNNKKNANRSESLLLTEALLGLFQTSCYCRAKLN